MSGREMKSGVCKWTRSAPDTIDTACEHSMMGWIAQASWLADEKNWAGRQCTFCQKPIQADPPEVAA